MANAPEKCAPRRSETKLQKQQRQRQSQQQIVEQSPSPPLQQQLAGNTEFSPARQASLMKDVEKIQYGTKVLDTIDQLRRRKARPSTDRICSYMLRKYSADAAQTLSSLEQLIKCEAVIEVDYKGGASYRNAFNWAKINSYRSKPEFVAKTKFNHEALEKAFVKLYLSEPDYVDQGVPPSRLIEKLLETKNPNTALKNSAEKYLDNEVANGYLVQMPNKNYSLANPPQENGDSEIKEEYNLKLYSDTSSFASNSSNSNGSPKCPIEPDGNVMDDSRSNSHKYSEQVSPKMDLDTMKNEDIYGIIVGRDTENENNSKNKQNYNGECLNENPLKDDVNKMNGEKNEAQNTTEQQTYRKRSKAERKQRLLVRSDDSIDLTFNDSKESNYKDDNNENEKISEKGESDQEAERSEENVSPTPSQTNGGSFRSARRKRARKVFDPSDNMVVKKKRGRHSNAAKATMASTQDVQEVAKCTVIKDKNAHRQCNECSKDKDEALMACRDCTVRVHPSCVYTQEEMVAKANTNWQCEDCKYCVACYESRQHGPIVTCFKCNDVYHNHCITPKLSYLKTKWYCNKCKNPVPKEEKINKNSHPVKEKVEHNNSHNISEIIKPKIEEVTIKNEIMDYDKKYIPNQPYYIPNQPDNEIDPTIPDVSDWSEEQVYKYFARLFPTDAEIFRQERIDGPALQLLKRDDVIDGFESVELGPRLKMWTQIVILQKRRNNRWDYWK